MAMKMSNKDSGDLSNVMQDILNDVQATEDEVLEALKQPLKNMAVRELRSIKRKGKLTGGRIKHLYQDVVVSKTKDKYGYPILKLRGGKHTGALWHLVNDGTYRMMATHFMDIIIDDANDELGRLTDINLGARSE